MSDLPIREYKWYIGIDVGFTGAVVWIRADGGRIGGVLNMPVTGAGRKREIDIQSLETVLFGLHERYDCVVGLEWSATRPGEGAERSERFGRQKGILETILVCHGIPHHKIPPNLWKGRLGLPGKDRLGANVIAAELAETYYPDCTSFIRGPRGGVLSGPTDALLIAHFLRTQTKGGMQSIVDRFGRDSPEAMAFVLSGGRPRNKV